MQTRWTSLQTLNRLGVYFYCLLISEAEAASKANLRCALVAREGNEDLTEKHFQDFLVIESFGELFGDDENEEEFKRLAREEGDDDDDEEEDLGEEDEDDVEDEEDDEEEDPDDDDDAQ